MLKGVSLSRLIICVCSSSLIIISMVYSSGPVGDYFYNLSWTPGNTGPDTPHKGPSFWLHSRKKVLSVLLPTHSQTDNINVVSSTPSIPDTMPFCTVLMNRSSLLNTDWVMRLYNYLHTIDTSVSPHVNMVFGDYDHRLLVLNWITAALFKIQPPLHNILVVSLEQTLCTYLLTNRNLTITCLVVQVKEMFLSDYLPTNVSTSTAHWMIQMKVRMPVLRLITHWGYDVTSYDSDAVLLRNPQVLYNDKQNFHVISSAGIYPPELSEVWGVALCAGAMLLRASPALGEAMHLCSYES